MIREGMKNLELKRKKLNFECDANEIEEVYQNEESEEDKVD